MVKHLNPHWLWELMSELGNVGGRVGDMARLNRAARGGGDEAILRWFCTLVSPSCYRDCIAHIVWLLMFRPCLFQLPWHGGDPGGCFPQALEG